ncbi:MAG TPA: 2-dehydro-3-deoxygalactonokinase [Trueperaceae bacterium]|nr:2-dehydro-3-deoxygalactonokinase [Trueperaceae bacterium]
MSPCYAVVDSGTTRTRLRVWRDDAVQWTGSRSVGARDTALDGNTDKVVAALRELLETSAARPTAIICSGMITSNMGLFELPHLPAPASRDDVAAGMRQKSFTDLSEVPLSFVPGVKTLPAGNGLAGLAAGDVLRGEEAEIAGLHDMLGLDRSTVYLHIGSHHKAIEVDVDGSILGSRTAVTGELLAAILGNTILKSSVVELDGLALDFEAALAGAHAARDHGFGRALFLVRVGEQLAGLGRDRMTSYLLGALASLDLSLLTAADPDAPVVVYGGDVFPRILVALLKEAGVNDVRVVEQGMADTAAAMGAVKLYELARELGVVA